jgi:hypothetical protein
MSELESLETITGRLEEISEILRGLEQIDRDLRQAAGANLGKVDHATYVGMTAQVTLIASLRQTLGPRMEMLRKAQAGLQPQPQGLFDDGPGYALRQQERSFPRRVAEGDEPEHG